MCAATTGIMRRRGALIAASISRSLSKSMRGGCSWQIGQPGCTVRAGSFDPAWLNETERRCDFSNGLDDWSVHGYIAGIRGHCALNHNVPGQPRSRPGREITAHQVMEIRRLDRHDLLCCRKAARLRFSRRPGRHRSRDEDQLEQRLRRSAHRLARSLAESD